MRRTVIAAIAALLTAVSANAQMVGATNDSYRPQTGAQSSGMQFYAGGGLGHSTYDYKGYSSSGLGLYVDAGFLRGIGKGLLQWGAEAGLMGIPAGEELQFYLGPQGAMAFHAGALTWGPKLNVSYCFSSNERFPLLGYGMYLNYNRLGLEFAVKGSGFWETSEVLVGVGAYYIF